MVEKAFQKFKHVNMLHKQNAFKLETKPNAEPQHLVIALTKQGNNVSKYITNQYQSVLFPWEPGLVEWLQQQYPHSKYHIVALSKETSHV